MNNACYSSVSSRTPSLNHPTSPETYRSFLASFSSLPPRISQSIFPRFIFPISSTLLPTLSSTQQILQNSDSKAIQLFASPAPLLLSVSGTHTRLELSVDGLWAQWAPVVWPTFSFSLSHSDCWKYLSPQTSYTTPFSPILLSALPSPSFFLADSLASNLERKIDVNKQ